MSDSCLHVQRVNQNTKPTQPHCVVVNHYTFVSERLRNRSTPQLLYLRARVIVVVYNLLAWTIWRCVRIKVLR